MRNVPWTKAESAELYRMAHQCATVRELTQRYNGKSKVKRSREAIIQRVHRDCKKPGDCLNRRKGSTSAALHHGGDLLSRFASYLKKHPGSTQVQVMDALDLSPHHMQELLDRAVAENYQLRAPSPSTLSISFAAPQVDRLAVHRLDVEPVSGHIKLGVISDIHIASKLHRQECLQDFVDLAMNDYGIRRIFVPGDIMAGINMYAGQNNEIECWGMEQQVQMAVDLIPRRKGLVYDIIGGNHDESLLKAAGANAIQALTRKRTDITEHGFYSALIDLVVPGAKAPLKIELFHPDKAGAYAQTYHVQKAIEQIPAGMKPHILLVGHEHQANFMPDYRGVAAFMCGCFEDQTLYLKRKHLAPAIGGWIIDVGLASRGSVRTLTSTWIRYFHSRRGPLRITSSDERMDRSVGMPG